MEFHIRYHTLYTNSWSDSELTKTTQNKRDFYADTKGIEDFLKKQFILPFEQVQNYARRISTRYQFSITENELFIARFFLSPELVSKPFKRIMAISFGDAQ